MHRPPPVVTISRQLCRGWPFGRLLCALLCLLCFPPSRSHAGDSATAAVKVLLSGYVLHPGKYRFAAAPTIEAALARAGGWNGKGGLGPDDGIPARWCAIYQRVDGHLLRTRFAVAVDQPTRRITVTDAAWKNYRLQATDSLALPGVFF